MKCCPQYFKTALPTHHVRYEAAYGKITTIKNRRCMCSRVRALAAHGSMSPTRAPRLPATKYKVPSCRWGRQRGEGVRHEGPHPAVPGDGGTVLYSMWAGSAHMERGTGPADTNRNVTPPLLLLVLRFCVGLVHVDDLPVSSEFSRVLCHAVTRWGTGFLLRV